MNFISIGGWRGTKIAIKDLGLFNEHHCHLIGYEL